MTRVAVVWLVCLLLTGCSAACAAPAVDQSFSGIGVELGSANGAITIKNVLPGGGADRAGLPVGSTLTAVDGKPVSGMAMQAVVDLLRGPEGSEVSLTVTREMGVTKTFKITRAKMEVIRSETFPGVYAVQSSPSEQVIIERISGNQFRIRSPQQHWAGMGLVGNGCFKGVFQMEDSPEVLKEFRGAAGFVRIDFRVLDTLLLRTRFNFWDNADKMVEKTLVKKAAGAQ